MRAGRSVLHFLPFIAIIFAAVYFYHIDAPFEELHVNYVFLCLSFIVLIVVFLFQAVIWHKLLLRFSIKVDFRTAFVSQFRNILMKYVPGKIWVILGRANIVSQNGYTLASCSLVSSVMQLLTIFSGFFVGVLGIVIFNVLFLPSYVAYIILVLAGLSLLLFNRELIIPEISNRFLLKITRSLSGSKIPPVADIIILSVMHWILMGFAFFLFFHSVTLNVGFYPILLQPLANNIGIISSFAPGGLGIREGIMITYLSFGGLSVSTATAISIAARLWFWVGEMGVFVLGWTIRKDTNN